jgi:hypothetical protein
MQSNDTRVPHASVAVAVGGAETRVYLAGAREQSYGSRAFMFESEFIVAKLVCCALW